MIAHLKDRAAALAALGWTGADAEWLAFVCLQSGAFLRSQYLRYVGESHPIARAAVRATVPVDRGRGTVERLGVPGVSDRGAAGVPALGVEPIRHRPNATPALWGGACSRGLRPGAS